MVSSICIYCFADLSPNPKHVKSQNKRIRFYTDSQEDQALINHFRMNEKRKQKLNSSNQNDVRQNSVVNSHSR